MLKNPIHQDWIKRATERDSAYAERQRAWMARPAGTASAGAQVSEELRPRPYVPRSREQNTLRGDFVFARFFSGGLWVLEVWTRETGTWMVLMSQVTTAKQ